MTTAVDAAVATLEAANREIENLLARLQPADLAARGIGGGEWSPKDLLGHLSLWLEIALRTIGEFAGGEQPWIVGVFAGPGPGPNDRELEARAPWPLARAREAYDRSHSAVIAALEGLAERDWRAPVTVWHEEPATLGGLLGVVLGNDDQPFGHAFAHSSDLARFVQARRPG